MLSYPIDIIINIITVLSHNWERRSLYLDGALVAFGLGAYHILTYVPQMTMEYSCCFYSKIWYCSFMDYDLIDFKHFIARLNILLGAMHANQYCRRYLLLLAIHPTYVYCMYLSVQTNNRQMNAMWFLNVHTNWTPVHVVVVLTTIASASTKGMIVVQCGALKRSQIFHNGLVIARSHAIFCENTLWIVFFLSYCSAVCDMMLCWIAL